MTSRDRTIDKSQYRRPRSAGPRPMALEPRVMYDGAVVDSAAAVAASAAARHQDALHSAAQEHEADHAPASHVPAAVRSEPPAPREIVFVDSRVPDYEQLVAGARSGVEVVVIQADEDGLAVIDRTLAGRSDISAIHLVTHGSDGDITLGTAELDSATLASRESEIAGWGKSLTTSGDILLYGCDVAADATGKAMVNQLAKVTGADVAASTDNTGGPSAQANWTLEYSTGRIEAANFLTPTAAAQYADRLSTVNLSGSTGWTAVMYGAAKDPVGDSQAGAADTDIVGDAQHGSLYVAFDDNGTATTADDTICFRLRIDNPTSSTYFGGVAVVGIDANLDGRIDLFMSVDGRNNGQAVKLLDPGTGANISPSTTTTMPLPTGWLPNNGVYSFSTSNYSVVAASAATDPNWNGDNDIGNDGKTDAFVSWRIPLSDMATVLAKPSPVDRNGNYGPRGSTGISGYTENTIVQYVNFTQTQNGPINGDLNGVGSSYDKNATFSSLGAFTAPMSATAPVADGPTLSINAPAGGSIGSDGYWNRSEDGSVTLTGSSSNLLQGTLVTVTVSDGSLTRTATGTVQNNGTWSATFAGGQSISGLADGALNIQASADPDGNAGTANDIHASTSIVHDRTPPALAIDQSAVAVSGRPTITGTSDLPDGSLITVTIDADNNPGTANLVYQVMLVNGAWSLDTSAVTPVSGTMPTGGLSSYSKITANASDAAGNSATATALNHPTVTSLSTNSTTPVISGTWSNVSGDTLTVTVNGATYTLTPSGNTWSLDLGTATPSSGSLSALSAGNTYSVTATVSRSGVSVTDTTSGELTITSTPVKSIGITGGSAASGTDTTPVIAGTSGNAGGFVIVRLDPNNDGDLSDAVTYSVVTDGSGNWSLDTGSATPISGTAPSAGFIGAVGVRATDSTGAVAASQVLTISTPSVGVGSITSTATTDANGQVSNSGGGASYLNATEDNSVTISGTATNGFTVDLVVSDANGNSVTASNLAVSGGNWSTSGLNLSSLDNGTLTVKATLSGTSISATNTSVTHDVTPNQIFITSQTTIPKNQATIAGASSLGSGVALTVTIRNSTDTSTVWSGSATTDASGNWSVTTPNGTNLVSGSSGNVIIKVAPTSTNTDAAGNITQQVVRNPQAVQNGAANTSDTITISTIAGDNSITANEITSGLTITGTTNLTTAATGSFTVTVGDGTTTQTATIVSNNSGTWTATLTEAQVQALHNGQLVVTATVNNTTSGIAVSSVALPTLSLATPTLTITDNTAGTATGDVVFTFTFSESMTGFTTGDITVTGGTKGTFSGSGSTYTLVVTPTASSSGNIVVSVGSSAATGVDSGRGNTSASDTQPYNTTGAAAPPTLTINADALASSSTPVITGTTNLAAGAPIVITIDPDNDSSTSNSLTYSATVQSNGSWSLDISSATPTSGSLPVEGLQTYAKIVAVATNAYGNSTTVTALDIPAVTAQTTNDTTPTISGTWTNIAGDTLSVTVAPSGGGAGTTYTVGSGLTISGNTWSITSSTLSDGTYNVTTTVTRSSTSKSDLTSSELAVDTLATVDITGGATRSGNDPTPVISGTTTGLAAGTVLTLSLDTDNNGSYDLVYKTTVQANGSWSVDTATAIPYSGTLSTTGLDGTIPMRATATDAAGNTGLDTQTLTVDVTPPAIGFTSGTRTPDSTPVISGTSDLPAGSTITINIDPNNDGNWADQQTYTTTVQSNGTWSVQTTTALSGTVGVRASGTDAVGNTATVDEPLTIDPNAPTVSVTPVATANNDYIADSSEDDAIVIAGATTAIADGETLSISITDGVTTITDTATVSGNTWQLAPLNLSGLANGTITVTATYVDGSGIAYPAGTTFMHDKSATVSIDSISEDTGIIADFITKDSTVSITGSSTANAAVSVVVKDSGNNTVASFSVSANSSGAWSTATTSALGPGNYTLYATVGGTTVSKAMTIVDATAPTLVSSTPADNAGSVTPGNDLALTFSKTVIAGSGIISVYRADGTLIESFNVATGIGDDGGSLSFNGTTGITLNPGHDLANATGYYIHVDSGAVIDSAGNSYAGIADSTTLNFTTASAASAPTQTPTIVSMSKDSGSSSTDFITSDGSSGRTISGTLTSTLNSGEVVEVSFDGGNSWTTATTSGTSWSVTDSGSHSGDWTIEARVTNTTLHASGPDATQGVTLDTTAPTAPAVNTLTTTSTAPTLTGSATLGSGETLTVTINGATYSVTPSGGSWSLDLASAVPFTGSLGSLAAGNSYAVTATVTDLAGNITHDATTNELTIAAPNPTQTPAIVSMTQDTGSSTTDFITADGAAGRTVSGTLTTTLNVGEVVEVSFDGGNSWTVATTSGTSWSITDSSSHGSDWLIEARVTNTTTHASGPSGTQNVTLDTTAPVAPTVNTLTTTSTAPTLTGSATAGSGETLTISVNGATYAVTPSGGNWSLDLSSAVPISGTLGSFTAGNAYAVTATVSDAAGNTTSDVTTNELTIAASGPTQTPVIVSMTQDTGSSSSDFITADGTAGRTVSGTLNTTLDVGEVVEISFDGGNSWSIATTSGTGWTAIDSNVHGSDWLIEARVTNSTTHVSGPSATQSVTLDATAPTAPTVDNLTTTSTAPTLTGTATVGTGESLNVTVNGATYAVTPSGSSWSLDLATAIPVAGTLGSFSAGSAYAVTATITDLAGNAASDATTNELTIAATGPTQAPAIVSMTQDTGSSSTDFITSDGSSGRTVAGTLTTTLSVGEVVEVSFDGGSSWTTATTSGTSWSITDGSSHGGNWIIEARVTNTTTHASGPSGTQNVTLDTAAPAAPTVNTLNTTSTVPTLTGNATLGSGETLSVTVNGATYAVTPVGNSWSLDLASAVPVAGSLGSLSAGNSYAVTATVTDLAGNLTHDVTTNELTIAASGPTQTPTILSMTQDTGSSSTDFITADGSAGRTVSGTLTTTLNAGEVVEVSFDGGSSWTTATTSGTGWTATDSSSHASDWIIEARVTNTTTHVSGPGAVQSVTLDTTAPTAPAVDTLITTSTAPTLTGTATLGTGEVLTVTVNGATYAVTPGGGSWSLDLSSAVPISGTLGSFTAGNAYAVTATVSDTAGNTASDVTTNELTIAAADPTQTPAIVSMTQDTGVSSSDFVTADGSAGRSVSGTLTTGLNVGEVVEVSFDGGSSWTVASTSGTSWSIADSGSHNADWTIEARVTNTTTHASGPSATQQVSLDTTPPAAPTVNTLTTTSTAPTLTGSAIVGAGDTLSVTVNGATYAVTPTGGSWSLDLSTALPVSGTRGGFIAGQSYDVTATVTDVAGNTTADATASELTIAAAGPTQTPAIVSMTKDSGSSAADFITADGSAGRTVAGTLTTTLNAGEVVEVSFDGGSNWTTAATSGTSWSATDSGAHGADWIIVARVTNSNTHVSGSSTTQNVTLDTTAPFTPIVNTLVTANITPTLTGTSSLGSGELLRVTVNGATYDVTPVGTSWTLDLSTAVPLSGTLGSFSAGHSYAVTATAVDVAGNASTDVTTNELTIVAVGPTQTPVITSMTRDTGVSSSDFVTADGAAGRTVSGTLTTTLNVGEIVEVSFDGGSSWTTATTSGTGWTATDSSSHGGNWIIEARVTNTTTHASGPTATQIVTLDTAAPTVPTVDAQITTSTAPTLSGTATLGAGELLSITVNGATYTVTPVGGSWSLDLAAAIPASGTLGSFVAGNAYSVTATVTDLAGNTSTDATSHELIIASTGPSQKPDIVSMTKDTGNSAIDFITADGSAGRTVSGTVPSALNVGEVVEVSFDGGNSWIVATTSGTAWTATDIASHTGDWTIAARVTNTVTHVSGASAMQRVTLDTSAPAVPTVNPLTTTGSLPTLSGTALLGDGETLSVTVNGATYAVTAINGTWSLDLSSAVPVTGTLGAFNAGNSYAVTATVVDVAGNTASDTTTNELTIAATPIPVVGGGTPPPLTPPADPIVSPPSMNEPSISSLDPVGTRETDPELTSIRDHQFIIDDGTDAIGDFTPSNAGRGLYTRADGFQIIVLKAQNPDSDSDASVAHDAAKASLILNRGIPDVDIKYTDREMEVSVPRDAFAHSRNDAVITLTVLQTNGKALPGWLSFDPRTGVFHGIPPKGMRGQIEIRVIARDQNGNQVETTFRIRVEEAAVRAAAAASADDINGHEVAPMHGKTAFSEQLKDAAKWGRPATQGALLKLVQQTGQERMSHASQA